MVRTSSSKLLLSGLLLVAACGTQEPSKAVLPTTPTPTVPQPTGSSFSAPGIRATEEPWWTADAPQPVASQPGSSAPPIEQTFTFNGDVLFDVGAAGLSQAAGSQLSHLARLAMQHPEASIEIVGHTDNTPGPTASFNDELSLLRATSVQAWLMEAGIEGQRVTVDGRGAGEPIASNDTAAGRATNRRVTVTIRTGP